MAHSERASPHYGYTTYARFRPITSGRSCHWSKNRPRTDVRTVLVLGTCTRDPARHMTPYLEQLTGAPAQRGGVWWSYIWWWFIQYPSLDRCSTRGSVHRPIIHRGVDLGPGHFWRVMSSSNPQSPNPPDGIIVVIQLDHRGNITRPPSTLFYISAPLILQRRKEFLECSTPVTIVISFLHFILHLYYTLLLVILRTNDSERWFSPLVSSRRCIRYWLLGSSCQSSAVLQQRHRAVQVTGFAVAVEFTIACSTTITLSTWKFIVDSIVH